MTSASTLIEQVIDAWQNMQAKTPLVQCITNSVAANYTANVLLASGASPAMIDNPYEAESFTKISSALSINLGTPTSEQMQALQISAKTAQLNGIPWVLDPVGYGPILAWRSQMTDELLQFKPSIIRGNASEISTLAGNQVQSKGVDSTLSSDQAYQQAYTLLAHADCIAISGESDYILSKELDVVIQVNGGSPLQPKITATGCALGALIAAYSAVTTPTIAALSAHVHFAIAGKLAANQAQTMGSFSTIFMDYIHMLDDNLIEQYADIKLLEILA
ncbi:hydroxyethylthiazole kinase [Acinetobacter pittii]|uniref:hydroxyethylthiazole kinase n=1 Tax=Acinetobacter pittii TaxID=48296 RepID=UPI00070B4CB6|nr:hydroxyethylthiazole kinase [Acinetobacter pittii]KRJ14967.1 hydroxyethylthiazole kinase [Acinetobacter pittii]MCM1964335.1 hydroxyethylthiazole kinase [Acinetobacter pittii]MCM1980733.1 hydroxyethylthiazole kinase [Acinetobacter pittii]MCU4344339.1 hydroxyethylthiazole kinase [Acinetobacter pittii]MCU4354905.1 hydroxyethylthiazole kinase [Acinetobacter pittii]